MLAGVSFGETFSLICWYPSDESNVDSDWLLVRRPLFVFLFSYYVYMENISLVLTEEFPLIAPGLPASSGNFHNRCNHPFSFLPSVRGFTLVMWKIRIAVSSLMLGNFTNYYFSFFPHLIVVLSLKGKPVFFENQNGKLCSNAPVTLASFSE